MISRSLIALVTAYQRFISPVLPAACRFEPTCSVYMADAIRNHGPLKGTTMGVRRISRCRPGGGSGFDPVPPHVSRET